MHTPTMIIITATAAAVVFVAAAVPQGSTNSLEI
jgi:hypothetical protein